MAGKLSSTSNSTSATDEALRRFDIAPADARVRGPVIRAIYGHISENTLRKRIKSGEIPRPIDDDPLKGWRIGDLRKALRGE